MKTKNLKSTFFLCLVSCILCLKVNAQIVYTDVNPDVLSTGTYNLDLNNDGVTDFVIFHYTQTVTLLNCGTKTQNYLRVSPLGSNQVNDYSGTFTNKLAANVIISSNGQWSNAANQTIAYYIWTTNGVSCGAHGSGQWYNSATDGYLGLKLIVGVNTYYGWARLNAASAFASSFTIKDYTYNSTANQSILAGQTCSPQATIKANGPVSFCTGGSVVLSSKNSGNTLIYQWKKNNINIAGATNKNYTATMAGDYKVKVTDTINNCSKTSGIKTVTVPCRVVAENENENDVINKFDNTVSPLTTPNCNCSISGYGCGALNPGCVMYCHSYCTICTVPLSLSTSGSLSFCSGDSVVLTVNRTGTYQWKKNGVNISGATFQSYTAKTPGTYKCKVTNTFCGAEVSPGKKVTVPCRMTNENIIETLEHLSVYPNPATSSVTIKFPSDETGEIKIVNLFGQIVFSEKINQEQTQIDVSKFTSGMYVIRWNSGENNETKTFSVVK